MAPVSPRGWKNEAVFAEFVRYRCRAAWLASLCGDTESPLAMLGADCVEGPAKAAAPLVGAGSPGAE